MSYDYETSDYVDVAARIAEFREKYPDGRLRPLDPANPYRIETITGWDTRGNEVKQTYIVVAAAALRSADDPAPGVGMAYEVFPGKTNFTKGSELQNAETSAWGRAIVATLAADTKKGLASQDEVRNRRAEQDAEETANAPSDPATLAQLEADLDGATSLTQLKEFFGKARVASMSGKVNRADSARLKAVYDDRVAVLEKEAAAS